MSCTGARVFRLDCSLQAVLTLIFYYSTTCQVFQYLLKYVAALKSVVCVFLRLTYVLVTSCDERLVSRCFLSSLHLEIWLAKNRQKGIEEFNCRDKAALWHGTSTQCGLPTSHDMRHTVIVFLFCPSTRRLHTAPFCTEADLKNNRLTCSTNRKALSKCNLINFPIPLPRAYQVGTC